MKLSKQLIKNEIERKERAVRRWESENKEGNKKLKKATESEKETLKSWIRNNSNVIEIANNTIAELKADLKKL